MMKLRPFALGLILSALPFAAPAQEDDKGYLASLLEENLSGAGRAVVIDGFTGALSSRATIDRLTIADDQGIWLTLNGIVLDWSRSALLTGRVEVNELTADEIIVARKPLTQDSAPAAEAGGFSLPDLPVSVNIGALKASRIELGPDFVGEPVIATLEATVSLDSGSGKVDAHLNRIDEGPAATVAIVGSYAKDTGQLNLDLSAAEAQGGIAAHLLGLPGAPAAELTVAGSGPVTDFAAKLRLATDGQDRLQGTVTVKGAQDGGIGFAADIGGDVAPLFLPEYAEFFGPQVALKADGIRRATGALSLSSLDLSARSLDLKGSVDLASDGLPERFDLRGTLAAPDGAPVLLPMSSRMELARADLSLSFDAATDESWRGAVTVQGLDRDDLDADRLALNASGRIARPAGKPTLTASIDFAAQGLAAADPALAQALGSEVTGNALLSSQAGEDGLRMPQFSLSGDGYSISGAATLAGLSDAFRLSGRIKAQVADLSRAAALAKRPLSGAAVIEAQGQGSVLAGDFDLQARINGQDLTIGQAQADRLLSGASLVTLDAARDANGTTLRDFSVSAGPLSVKAQGNLSSTGSDVTADLALANLERVDPAWHGGFSTQVALTGPAGNRRITVSGNGQDIAIGQAEVDKLLAGTSTLAFVLDLTEAGIGIEKASFKGPQLTAEASGSVTEAARNLQLSARLANLGLFVPDFPGAVSLSGTANEQGNGFDLDLRAQGPGGIDATIKGNVAEAFDRADLAVTGRAQAALANPFLSGRLVNGPLAIDLRLRGPLGLPSLSGTVRLTNGRVADPAVFMALENVDATAQLGNSSARINANARFSTGGRVTAQGSVGLTAPFQGDIEVDLRNALLRDPQLFQTTANGNLRIRGPLTGGAAIAGQITLSETEVQIPSTGLGGGADLPGLMHRNEPAAVHETRVRAGLLGVEQAAAKAPRAAPFALNITVAAPNQLFIRGRGLDAELGGQIQLRGTTDNVQPNGAFSLLRGRLDILGRRLTLTEATMAMEGDLIPTVAIAASTESDGVTSSIRIDGPATEPKVSFTSSPELPEEEVLARLLFGRDLTSLSPLQAAQLASAVATLSGRGGAGIVGRLRSGFGLDDLDVQTDETGGAAVTAGKYLTEKIYSEVVVGSEGKTEVHLNFDLTKSVTVRGRAADDGSTGLGVFFEKDY